MDALTLNTLEAPTLFLGTFLSASERRKLPKADQSAILAVFEDLRQHGFNALGCQFRQIDGKLWEIKIRTSGGG